MSGCDWFHDDGPFPGPNASGSEVMAWCDWTVRVAEQQMCEARGRLASFRSLVLRVMLRARLACRDEVLVALRRRNILRSVHEVVQALERRWRLVGVWHAVHEYRSHSPTDPQRMRLRSRSRSRSA